ncbi:type I-E CRISPR-associated protein Cse2/CasB [Nocardia sp. SYP-A9097]|uniref:type I-E CRISPR-associated protein Cse2/CasB n=1 Tax=Nocardia sp. SYP-A9097 TaxID=2663237 RepID=UPI00129A0E25|nr:type I-E CRISPR-associated protein Cse2/CasB [Nocardia sp. SYP-A9097]MRH93037.1 type I-E CRISPR-associated protein Cse2/CasB [Nocardia sp. SYP-A9097]
MNTDTQIDKPTYRVKDTALTEFVAQRISVLQAQLMKDVPDAVAVLAKLRRGVGHPAGSLPELHAATLEGLPEPLTDPAGFSPAERDGAPTPWEQAAHDSITLYAWHQQSKREGMHRRGASFGTAMRVLGEQTSVEAVRRRFHALGTAAHHDARLILLRGLVSQLRAQAIPLDYGRLAQDLRRLHEHTYAHQVLLAWGRDYHRGTAIESDHTDTDTRKGEDQ